MSDIPEQMEKDDMERVQAAVNTLAEHFDTVQIFCTRCESGTLDGTVRLHLGAGNWYARYGQIGQWMIAQDESARIAERRAAKEDDT
jgi:hypothetical protein